MAHLRNDGYMGLLDDFRYTGERWLGDTISRAASSPARVFFLVFVSAGLVYSSTATWAVDDQDVLTNAVTAHRIGTTGSPVAGEAYRSLTEAPLHGLLGWFVEGERGVIGKYPPGVAVLPAPLYALFRDAPVTPLAQVERPDLSARVPLPSMWVSTLVAVVSTAAAAGLVAATVALIGSGRIALAGGLLFAFGTSAWGIASDQLWQHGPAMFWIALAGFLAGVHRPVAGGVSMGLAVLTRPHTAVIAASLGIGVGMDRKSPWDVARFAVGALAGLGLLIAYNAWFFGEPSIGGGYGSEGLGLPTGGVGPLLLNYAGALFSPRLGLFVWSPVVVVGLIGAVTYWRDLPVWCRAAMLGGLAYFVVQFALNRYNPGSTVPYRYPLEALTAAAPGFIVGGSRWLAGPGAWRGRVFFLAVALSLLGQALTVRG